VNVPRCHAARPETARSRCPAPLGSHRRAGIAARIAPRARGVLRAALVLTLCVASSGCARWFAGTCAQPGDFAGAVDNAQLKIPPGLSAPDTRAAMPIPPLSEPERPKSAETVCLDAPPPYAPPREPRPAA
jgi:hypothetical protein